LLPPEVSAIAIRTEKNNVIVVTNASHYYCMDYRLTTRGSLIYNNTDDAMNVVTTFAVVIYKSNINTVCTLAHNCK